MNERSELTPCIYVTLHEKTKHIAQKMILELRVPWPLMMFELPNGSSLKFLDLVVFEIEAKVYANRLY